MESLVTEQVYRLYLESLLSGDRETCARVVHELNQSGIPLKDLYINLFQRSLYETGELWESHRISVSVEHLATAITERLLTMVEPQAFSGPFREHTVIVACVADEYHQLGARMVADFFEFHGWRGTFLGANTPVRDLLHLIRERTPDLLALSLALYSNLPSLVRALDAVSSEFPKLGIFVGGQAFRWGGADLLHKYPQITYIPSVEVLEQKMVEYAGR